jgi:hypothetical protein
MNLFSVSGLTIVITALILTAFILSHGKTRLHRIWTLFNLAVLIWGIGCFLAGKASSISEALFAWRVSISGGLFIGVFFYHTMSVFSEIRNRQLFIIAYAQAMFFFVLTWTTETTLTNWQILFDSIYFPQATFFYALMVAGWIFFVYLGHKNLVSVLKNSKGRKHIQAKYLLGAFLVGFLGGSLTLVPAFNIEIYPIGNFGIPIYTFTVSYAILRHRLLDLNLILKKSMVYSLAAGIMTSLFVVIVTVMTKYFSDLAGVTSYTIMVFSALLIAILFNPLRTRIQALIDRFFYKKTYDYYSVIRMVSRDLATMFRKYTSSSPGLYMKLSA